MTEEEYTIYCTTCFAGYQVFPDSVKPRNEGDSCLSCDNGKCTITKDVSFQLEEDEPVIIISQELKGLNLDAFK
jgi:hypothetical protein